MRELLVDMVRMTADLIGGFKVTATSDSTLFQGYDESRSLILTATAKEPLNIEGEFGFNDLKLLQGLFKMPSFNAEGAKVEVEYMTRPGSNASYVAGLRFEGGDIVSRYRSCAPQRVWAFPTMPTFTWEVYTTPARSKLGELAQLSRLYSAVDTGVGISTVNGELIATLGDLGGSSHSAKVVLDTAVEGKLDAPLYFNVDKLLAIYRLAGDAPITIRFTNKGMMAIDIDTKLANITYILRTIA